MKTITLYQSDEARLESLLRPHRSLWKSFMESALGKKVRVNLKDDTQIDCVLCGIDNRGNLLSVRKWSLFKGRPEICLIHAREVMTIGIP